jgi:hypothetical protein
MAWSSAWRGASEPRRSRAIFESSPLEGMERGMSIAPTAMRVIEIGAVSTPKSATKI